MPMTEQVEKSMKQYFQQHANYYSYKSTDNGHAARVLCKMANWYANRNFQCKLVNLSNDVKISSCMPTSRI